RLDAREKVGRLAQRSVGVEAVDRQDHTETRLVANRQLRVDDAARLRIAPARLLVASSEPCRDRLHRGPELGLAQPPGDHGLLDLLAAGVRRGLARRRDDHRDPGRSPHHIGVTATLPRSVSSTVSMVPLQLRLNNPAPSSWIMNPAWLVPFAHTPRASHEPVGGIDESNVSVQLPAVPPRSMMRTSFVVEV